MPAKERDLSVLFADVSGSARLYEKFGDNAALQAVDRCLKRIERAVTGHRGRVVKTIGDEVMAVFESVDDAFQAAIEMQQSVSDLPLVAGIKLAIRVGFQHGPVIEEHEMGRGDVFGDCVNMAARLAGLAKPAQILIASQTQAALTNLLQLSTRDLAQMSVRGKSGEIHVFEVVWQTSADLTMVGSSAPTRMGAGGATAGILCRGCHSAGRPKNDDEHGARSGMRGGGARPSRIAQSRQNRAARGKVRTDRSKYEWHLCYLHGRTRAVFAPGRSGIAR